MIPQNKNVLFVDLDGTLTYRDTLVDCFITLLQSKPWLLLKLLFIYARQGRASFKESLALSINLDPLKIRFREEVLKQLPTDRTLILATGSNRHIANKIAAHLKIFSDVLASDSNINLTGSKKLAAMQKYSKQPLGYVGNEEIDFEVWQGCDEVWVVADEKFCSKVQQTYPNKEIKSIVV